MTCGAFSVEYKMWCMCQGDCLVLTDFALFKCKLYISVVLYLGERQLAETRYVDLMIFHSMTAEFLQLV